MQKEIKSVLFDAQTKKGSFCAECPCPPSVSTGFLATSPRIFCGALCEDYISGTFRVIFISHMPRQFRFTVPLKPIAALCHEDDTVVCKNKWFSFFFSFKLAGCEKKENVIFFQLCVICKKYWCERIFQNENLFKKKVFKNEIPFFFLLSADLWQLFVSMVLLRTILPSRRWAT